MCLFNPKFNPILCFSNIKTQICTMSPIGCSNCVQTYLRHIFSSPPLDVPSLVTSRGEEPHPATAAVHGSGNDGCGSSNGGSDSGTSGDSDGRGGSGNSGRGECVNVVSGGNDGSDDRDSNGEVTAAMSTAATVTAATTTATATATVAAAIAMVAKKTTIN